MARTDRERGAALVEMALVAPILLVLLFGVWSVARAYNVRNTLDHAAREAARHAATIEPWDPATSPDAVRAVADAELAASAIDPSDVTTGCIEFIPEAASGCTIAGTPRVASAPADEVIVVLEFDDFPMSFVFFQTSVDMQAQAVTRWEG